MASAITRFLSFTRTHVARVHAYVVMSIYNPRNQIRAKPSQYRGIFNLIFNFLLHTNRITLHGEIRRLLTTESTICERFDFTEADERRRQHGEWDEARRKQQQFGEMPRFFSRAHYSFSRLSYAFFFFYFFLSFRAPLPVFRSLDK